MFALATAPMHAPSVAIQSSWTVHIGGGLYRHECNLCDIRGAVTADWQSVDAERDAHDSAEHRAALTLDRGRSVWLVPDEAAESAALLASAYPGQVFAYVDDAQTFQAVLSFL